MGRRFRVDQPRPGQQRRPLSCCVEKIIGNAFTTYPGGKGTSQALAAARAGAKVQLYGAIGRDTFAERTLERLAAGNVDLASVTRVDVPTG